MNTDIENLEGIMTTYLLLTPVFVVHVAYGQNNIKFRIYIDSSESVLLYANLCRFSILFWNVIELASLS